MNSIKEYVDKRVTKIRLSMTHIHDKKLQSLLSNQRYEVNIECKHKFYTRVSNLTDIEFNNSEIEILNKGLKYNIPTVHKNQIISEVVNAEAAIKSIPHHNLQNEARQLINIKLKKTLDSQNKKYKLLRSNNTNYANQLKIIKKIVNNNAIVTEADKGNTCLLYTSRCV